jgi:hypothetical protein
MPNLHRILLRGHFRSLWSSESTAYHIINWTKRALLKCTLSTTKLYVLSFWGYVSVLITGGSRCTPRKYRNTTPKLPVGSHIQGWKIYNLNSQCLTPTFVPSFLLSEDLLVHTRLHSVPRIDMVSSSSSLTTNEKGECQLSAILSVVKSLSFFSWSTLQSSTTVPVVPPRHDGYPRFLSAAWPYYAGAISTSVGFILFSAIFLAGDVRETKKGKGRKLE